MDPWLMDPWVLGAIAGMTVVTYLTRAGGYFLFRLVRMPQGVRDALGYVPGALFVSYVAPALVSGGPQQWAGAAATAALMIATGNLTIAILGGTGAAWVVWAYA